MRSNNVLIMGLGNYLMGDEGLGVHAIRKLQSYKLPSNVDLLDGGTAGFQLMPFFEQYEHLILIDATLDDLAPGTIRHLRPKFSADFPNAMSTHEIGLKDLVESMILLDKLPNIDLYVMSINRIQGLSVQLSEDVELALDRLCREIIVRVFELVNQKIELSK